MAYSVVCPNRGMTGIDRAERAEAASRGVRIPPRKTTDNKVFGERQYALAA